MRVEAFTPTEERTDGVVSVTREISRGIVRIYKEHLGRGPTHAHTTIRDHVVVCVLEDSLTKAEAKLTERGRRPMVRRIRREFQEAMRDEIIAVVEAATQRSVACMLSDHSPDPDYAVEVLVLAHED